VPAQTTGMYDQEERTVAVLLVDGCGSGAGADRVSADTSISSKGEGER
jgi:hypothetical protein